MELSSELLMIDLDRDLDLEVEQWQGGAVEESKFDFASTYFSKLSISSSSVEVSSSSQQQINCTLLKSILGLVRISVVESNIGGIKSSVL